MGRRGSRSRSKGKKGGTANTGNRLGSQKSLSSNSLESEPRQSPRRGGPSKKRSRVEFEGGESSEDNTQCGQCQSKDEELARLVAELSIKDKIKEEYEEMKAKFEEEKRQKEEALTRLSAMASARLRDNNPNIADLSDQNRPTKIAEKLSELYDNEWTDAFDSLSGKIAEIETINFLLDVLKRSYKACKTIASENYFEKVQRIIEFPVQDEQSVTSSCVLPDELKHHIKEFRKLRAVHVIEDIQKAIQRDQQFKFDNVPEVVTYTSRCVELCWLMAVQDPPLVLSDHVAQEFDTNVFKDYTKRGKYVKYVVWPALFLNEGGPLLTKGVAQGCKDRPEK